MENRNGSRVILEAAPIDTEFSAQLDALGTSGKDGALEELYRAARPRPSHTLAVAKARKALAVATAKANHIRSLAIARARYRLAVATAAQE